MKKFLLPLFFSILNVLLYGQSLITTPSQITIIAQSADSRAHGLGGGQTYTHSASAWPSSGLKFGFPLTLPQAINGYNNAPPNFGCSGMSDVVYNSTLSNFSNGLIVYTGNTNYRYLNTSGFYVTTSIQVKVEIDFSVSVSAFGGYIGVSANQNFNYNIIFKALSPIGALYFAPGTANTWTPAISLFDYLHTDPNSSICTSYNQGSYYSMCDDGIACTSDLFSFPSGCANSPNNALCDDGNQFTCESCNPNSGCLNDGPAQVWYVDADLDNYGSNSINLTCSNPGSGFSSNNQDCNDASNTQWQLLSGYVDGDGDGYTVGPQLTNICSGVNLPSGYIATSLGNDCDDVSSNVFPGVAESCNGIDDNCDGNIDEGVQTTFYFDNDGDGYGAGTATNACQSPGAGYVTNNTDCNDNNALLNSISSETCNNFDDDCDGTVDNGLTFVDYYNDNDGDGYGAGTAINACQSLGAGYVTNNTDCNDNNAALNSISSETCNNFDDDCDGTVDNGLTFVDYYNDNDGDGYGAGTATNACQSPGASYVTNNTDCNDNNAALNSISSETCNNFDDDCDGTVDNGLTFVDYYNDNDGDGYGAGTPTNACQSPGASYVTNSTDCNDNNAALNSISSETCNNFDDDCDGTVDNGLTFVDYYNDNDGDGYGAGTATNACQSPGAGYVTNNTDCNDNNAALNSISSETCNNFDDDCDGTVDNGLTFVDYYNDNDGDGYGAGTAINACLSPGAGYVTNNTDCNDNNAALNSISSETCNNFDDDCDGTVDNGLTFVDYYNDNDGDGYGAGTAINACLSPGAGYVTNNTDCNDNNASVKPGATEICANSIDDNCNGLINENCSTTILGDEPAIAIQSGNINQFGMGVQFNVAVNLWNATSSNAAGAVGNDIWYLFTAQHNAIRVGLKGSTTVGDDNRLKLYNYMATPSANMIPIDMEDDVHPGSQGLATDGGDEVLYYDQLVQGQQYWLCVENTNATPGVCTLTISYLMGSQPDIGAYTNNTGVYSNTCGNFKAKYRPNAFQYTVNRHTGNDLSSSIGWSYTIPNTSTTTTTSICQLGKILPPNLTGQMETYYVSVDVYYSMKDAFGNTEEVYANGNVISPVGLNSEADLFLRLADQCPVFKGITSTLSTNRSVCGIEQYQWNFAMVYPQSGLPIMVNGAMGGSRILGMSAISGIANGQRYDVKIRSKHVDGVSLSAYGSIKCMKTIGAAGMVLASEEALTATKTEGLELYPNPNRGDEVRLQVTNMEGVLNIEVLDAMGRLLQSTTGYSDGNITSTLSFEKALSSGLYEVRVSNGKEQRVLRMVVGR